MHLSSLLDYFKYVNEYDENLEKNTNRQKNLTQKPNRNNLSSGSRTDMKVSQARKNTQMVYRTVTINPNTSKCLFAQTLSQDMVDSSITGQSVVTYYRALPDIQKRGFNQELTILLSQLHQPIPASIAEYAMRLHNRSLMLFKKRSQELQENGINPDALYRCVQSRLQFEAIKACGMCRIHGSLQLSSLAIHNDEIIGICDTGNAIVGSPLEDIASIIGQLDWKNHLITDISREYSRSNSIHKQIQTTVYALRILYALKTANVPVITKLAQKL